MSRDAHNTLVYKAALGINRVADDTAQTGITIDMQGFESVEFVILTGVIADSNATFAVDMEEDSDSGMATATAVADRDLLGTEALAAFDFGDDDAIRKIGYKGHKRFVRCNVTPSGNGSDADFGIVAVMTPNGRVPGDDTGQDGN